MAARTLECTQTVSRPLANGLPPRPGARHPDAGIVLQPGVFKEDAMSDGQVLTVREAGRRGGRKVKEMYGHEHYVKMGQKGGQVMASTRGKDFYSDIGRLGGQAVKERHGMEFFREMGRKGGGS